MGYSDSTQSELDRVKRREIKLDIPDDLWEDCSDDGSQLAGPTLKINGAHVLLEAHAVREMDNNGWVNDGDASRFEELSAAFNANDIMQERLTINGREYVVFAIAAED